MQMVNILAGQTGGLFPVLFMTGGPAAGSGPYPSLFLDLVCLLATAKVVLLGRGAR